MRVNLRPSTLIGVKQGRKMVSIRKFHWAVWYDPYLCLTTHFELLPPLERFPQLLFGTTNIRYLGFISRGPTQSGPPKLIELAIKG